MRMEIGDNYLWEVLHGIMPYGDVGIGTLSQRQPYHYKKCVTIGVAFLRFHFSSRVVQETA